MATGDGEMRDLFGSESEEEDASPVAPQPDSRPASSKPAVALDDDDDDDGDDLRGPAQPAPASHMKELFGSEDEDEDEDVAVAGTAWSAEDRDGDAPPERGPPMAVEVPLRAVPPPADVFLVRASNILGIEAEPWDAAAFAAAQADATARERVRDLTTVRWRWVTRPDGSRARQSNASLVRWSDGSQQLLLGRDVLDVRAIDVSADQQFLLARHAQTIQGQGQLACKLVFRPASLESAFHRRLAASVDGGAARAAPKVRGTATVADPARAKRERELHEEAGIRERERAAERKARTLQRNAAYRPAAPRLSSAYLEEEDEPAYEEEGIDLRRPRYDPDEEARAVARLAAAQRGGDGAGKRGRTIASDDEEEELSDDDGDDLDDFLVPDEEEERPAGSSRPAPARAKEAPSPAPAKRRAVLLDSDDDD